MGEQVRFTLLYSHMLTGLSGKTNGGYVCVDESKTPGWVEPCSCVVSTVKCVSGGVGGTVVQVVVNVGEQYAKRMLSRSSGDGTYI